MTLLDRLRSETRDCHDRIETDLDLLSHGLTLERYTEIIRRFHAFVRAWEPLVERRLGQDFYGPRRKLRWLEADLAALGACTWQGAVPLPAVGDRAEALGSLYVLEGATLGGQAVLRHLRTIGLAPAGIAYFGSYGRQVGAMWSQLRAVLATAADPGHDRRIVGAARDTFACLSALMRDLSEMEAPATPRLPGRAGEVCHV